MKKRKNRLDEMQEQKMLKIEHYGFWLAYFGLFIAIMIQVVYYGQESNYRVAGEFAVFMCLSVYLILGCMKNDIWDRCFAPTWKTNICAGLLAAIVGGFFRFLIVYREKQDMQESARHGIQAGIWMGVLCTLLLSISLLIYRKRQERFDQEDEPGEEWRKK